jgi:hypothetical protein
MCPESAVPASAALPRPAALPPFAEYIRAVFALGRRAIRPALPALVFVYFYRLGMGLFMDFSPSALGTRAGAPGSAGGFLMVAAGYLPMFVLVYTPFLPFLDSLLRGGRGSFLDAVKQVLEAAWQLLVSLILQVAVVVAPVALLLLAAGALTAGFSGGLVERLRPDMDFTTALRMWVVALFFIPSIAWIFFSGFHLIFATPYVVLERRGPLASIGQSWHIAGHYFWGLLGRILGYGLLVVLFSVIAATPTAILSAGLAASENTNPLFKVPGIVWSSAVDTLLFPFGAAALLLLYRAVVPAGSLAPGAADSPAEAEPRPVSPFIFE